MFQRKKHIDATYAEWRTTRGKDFHIGARCAALVAGGMMLHQGQLHLRHGDMATLLSEPQWLTTRAVALHLIAASRIHPHKHQGRFQQALLGNSFQEVYIEEKQPIATEASWLVLPWGVPHKGSVT